MKPIKILTILLWLSTLLFSKAFVENNDTLYEEKLLESINVKDVVIYDLDYYKDLVIAVGEDNSPKTRKLASQEEYYESVMLRSTDGGRTWQKVEEVISVPYEKVIVFDEKKIMVVSSSIEGFGGLLKISSDGGE